MADTGAHSKFTHSQKRSVDIPLRPTTKRKSTSKGSSLLGSLRHPEQVIVEPLKRDMAASFLQYCAMCEKQITTPCNSILYCSEACRRKDGCKPLSAANMSQVTPPPSMPSSPTRPVLNPRTPTGTYADIPVVRIPAELHDHKSDLDPTEWKPQLPNRKHSEAFRFLSQFHRSTSSVTDNQSMNSETRIEVPSRVPTPSLVNTPTTVASSLSTSAGFGSGYGGYDFNTRPLPPRNNRWYNSSGSTPRGTDLVTPHVAPPVVVSEPVMEDEDLWGKKMVIRGSTPKNDGLARLLGVEK